MFVNSALGSHLPVYLECLCWKPMFKNLVFGCWISFLEFSLWLKKASLPGRNIVEHWKFYLFHFASVSALKTSLCSEPKWLDHWITKRAQAGKLIVNSCLPNFRILKISKCYYYLLECFYGNGRGYRGSTSTTVSGYECQSWNATTFRRVSEAIYADIKNSSNLCRNPVGFALDGPWCFTKNETLGWEYCNVSRCAKEGQCIVDKWKTSDTF